MAYTTINKSSEHFNTKLYTGNGTTDTAITGVGFQPDLSIIKARDMAYNHNVMDAVRGSTKRVATDLTDAESTQAQMIKSFASDGFNLGDNGGVNQDTKTYASWNWKANGTGSSNTDGSITSTVSANTTSGFSIVSYTGNGSAGGSTVGHGLNAVPKMFIIKNRSTAKDWTVYHNSISAENYVELNTTIASTDSSSIFNDTAPTSSVFSIGNNGQVNTSGDNYISYCFSEKKDLVSLEATQGMEMLMEHLFIQDLNQLLFLQKELIQQTIGKYKIVLGQILMFVMKDYIQI
ncbi:hypothetical protein [uncultured phage MedDCM-OCT-S04-C1161]|nr:hypothetical protein [uncultured phage MedDCM-OCT-S04-C1035]ADD94159.1 hypothetical protein [uncultured phage MedDCM-OCT-S04-C1161]ADD94200.1 hypothetical protein [uncultured phage MedDCM-OCT-S04-C1227]ADD94318.1 hypothetical protein [uncultured phage MedDCM-OCT-S04-C890]